MSNEELFKQAYGSVHVAAEDLQKLAVKIDAGAVIGGPEFLTPIQKVRRDLQEALCAVVELENRAKGMVPPKRGD